MLEIKVVNKSKNPLPQYETSKSSGMDLRADIESPIVLKPMERKIIPTGLYIALPEGYEAQIRARSGLAIKHGITCLNGIGTVDEDFRGNVGAILINLSNEEFTINPGDRIAQMVICKYQQAKWALVDQLDETDRGGGGFGHSGMK